MANVTSLYWNGLDHPILLASFHAYSMHIDSFHPMFASHSLSAMRSIQDLIFGLLYLYRGHNYVALGAL